MNKTALKSWLKTVPAQLQDLLVNRIDYHFYPELLLGLLLALCAYPISRYAPVEWGYENGVVENSQMVLLFLSMIVCWKVRHNHALFRFICAILFVLMLRETNFGKTIFYPDPNRPNKFLSWDKIPYAPYVDPVMIVYGILTAFYFIRKKIIHIIPAFIKSGRLPFWNIFLMLASIAVGVLVDKCFETFLVEEIAELIFYLLLLLSLWRAGRKNTNWLPE